MRLMTVGHELGHAFIAKFNNCCASCGRAASSAACAQPVASSASRSRRESASELVRFCARLIPRNRARSSACAS